MILNAKNQRKCYIKETIIIYKSCNSHFLNIAFPALNTESSVAAFSCPENI